MIASFKNFIQNETDKFSLFVEEEGMSTTKMLFPITQPLANLLSLIPSNTLKADALNWIVTEGLMEASKGRENLLELVRKRLAGKTPKSNFLPKNTINTLQVAEMAREVMHKSDEIVKSQDLFSREAWERIPELEKIIIQGKSIPDYYKKTYEPKLMYLESEQSKSGQIVIDLQELNKNLESHGLKPFEYGGFDGYIQRVEKGDYLPDSKKRSAFSANNQQGLDLRPERKLVNGEQVIVDDLKGYNKKKTDYVYNFHGGSTARDVDRAKDAISVLRVAFVSIVNKIDDPEHKIWKDLIDQKNIKPIEFNSKKLGKEFVFKRLGLNSGNLPDYISKEDFEFIIENGLRGIQQGDWKNYMNMEVSSDKGGAGFEKAESKDELKPGSYFPDGKNVYYKFTEDQIKEILKKVNKYYPKFPLQIKFMNIPILEKMITTENKNGSIVRATDNPTVLVEPQFNNGYNFLKNHPDDREKKVVQKIQNVIKKIHTYEGVKKGDKFASDYDKYIFNTAVKIIKVNIFYDTKTGEAFAKTIDPNLKQLIENGFKWDETNWSDGEKKSGKPLGQKKVYTLTNGKIKLNIEKKGEDYYLIFPLNNKASGFNPTSSGDFGRAILASPDNYLFNAGEMGEHIKQNPLSSKDYEKFKQTFEKQYGGGDAILEAPFVADAIIRATNSAKQYDPSQLQTKTAWQGSFSKAIGQSEHLTDAWEGIKAISGDRAFHVGYLNPEELNTRETEERAIKLKDEFKKIYNDPSNPDNEEKFANYIINWLQKAPFKGMSVDWSDLKNKIQPKMENRTDDILKKIQSAVEVNANEGRTRLLSRFLLTVMMKRIDKVSQKFKSITGNSDYGDKDFSSSANDIRIKNRDSGMGVADSKSREDIAKLLNIDLNAEGDPDDDQTPATQDDNERIARFNSRQTQQSQPPKPPAKQDDNERIARFNSRQTQQTQQPQPPQPTATQDDNERIARFNAKQERKVESNNGNLFKDYKNWRSLKEMAGSFAVSTNKKPKDGDGWNWWGAKGDKSGISISGEVDDVKTNPTGKKNAKKR